MHIFNIFTPFKIDTMTKILIIDDEISIRRTLKEILEFENYKVDAAEDGKAGLKAATETQYDVIFCDIKMPQMDGLEVLVELKKAGVSTPVIMISGHGNIETAVDSIKTGAYDFIEKPLDLNRILVTIKNAREKADLVQETKVLKKEVKKLAKSSTIIGESKPIKDILEIIAKVGPTDARVLVTGPNGSGKELVARQLHDHSTRSKSPFIEVNCAAIPSELIE